MGENRRNSCYGKTLELEGIFTDGTEFSWDDYRDKAVLVCCVPKKPLSKEQDSKEYILEAYRAYHNSGLELVWYAPDDDEAFS
ncbi:MAG: hypothetical protein IKX88_15375, partial [Thermoguttaceae bacterium]|nr:hypothetical protein [Thermoguttaceae bacterium]